MAQDNCPFTRTKKNDLIRFNPASDRIAICFQLHDDLKQVHAAAHLQGDAEWLDAVNHLKMSLEFAKRAKGAPPKK